MKSISKVAPILFLTVALACSTPSHAQITRNNASAGPASGLTVNVGNSTGSGYSTRFGTAKGSSGGAITGTVRPPENPTSAEDYGDTSFAAEVRCLGIAFLVLTIPACALVVAGGWLAGAQDSAHQDGTVETWRVVND